MKSRKTKLDAYFALFNCHLNNAKELAREEFIEKYGLSTWEREIQPIIDAGIMSIFQQEPNERTQFYVDTVTRIVNEDRESAMEDEILATKREIIKSMEESERATIAIPATSTIVNVFPGDLRDWFAGQALAGLIANRRYFGHFSDAIPWNRIASEIYELADAMLTAREAKK